MLEPSLDLEELPEVAVTFLREGEEGHRREDGAALELLLRYGYTAANCREWHTSKDELLADREADPELKHHPHLVVRVVGHEEREKHTIYAVDCMLALIGTGRRLGWKAYLRLSQFQKDIHDPVRSLLGSK